ncbi:hypothetical protein pdam_00012545 [Pocillopora damicornis]|uniref:LIM zinc-binding domain-containing protein n=1 Tax=Pocillopora damicornis TaxID=46731 RepID=A0A3M6TUC2_POCDA|nr:hypothetical protein pdam_00012545 [Pocillopora damicornis]
MAEGSQDGLNLHMPKKFTLGHEMNAGAPCLQCGPVKCEGGLDLHFWRKICKTCKCKPEEHDIKTVEEAAHKLVVHSLFSKDSPQGHIRDYFRKLEEANKNKGQQSEYAKQYAWVPPGLQQGVLMKYMESLPPEVKPKVGSEGAKYRRKQMMYQLPIHDHDPEYCDNLTEPEKASMRQFCEDRNQNALGVGDVREKTNPVSKWEGAIYCGRHYAELYKPRCAACDELIFSREYTQAEDRNWHRKHFCCYECDRDLGGLLYVARDGHPHCMECYNRLYARRCFECREIINADAQRIEYEGEFWHATDVCFKCGMCKRSLIGKQFLRHPRKNQIFCSTDCAKRY